MADTHNAPVLAIDTSVSVAVSVVGSDGGTLVSHVVDAPRQQAEQLAPLVEDALREVGLTAQDLGTVVVGTGPAPFTGLRVGLVTARTIAFAAGVPAHGVCSLDALALGAARSLALAVGDEVVVVTDAKRREVYWGRYRVTADGVSTVAGPGVAAAAALVEDGSIAGAVVAGPAAEAHAEVFSSTAARVATDGPTTPDASLLVEIAAARLAHGDELPTAPLYLRRPDAQAPAARKRATG